MTSRSVTIPFVRGLQQAGDDKAPGESGKLESAFNLHIRPEHADVLYRRPGITARNLPESTNTFSRISESDGKLFVQGLGRVYTENGVGTFVNVAQYPATSELSAELVPTVKAATIGAVQHVGYHERSDGAACQVWFIGPTLTDGTYYARTKPPNGFWSDAFVVFQGAISSGGRIWALPKTGGGWVLIYQANALIQLSVTASDTNNTITLTDSGSPVLYDVGYVNGHVRLLYRATGGDLKVRGVNLATGTFASPTLTVDPAAPRYACVAVKSDGSSYVYHGGYAGGASVDLKATQVNAGLTVATARGTIVQAFDTTTQAVTAVCSELKSHLDNTGNQVSGSWVYVVGNGLGRLFWVAEGNSIVTTPGLTSSFVGAVEPMGKLWTDSSFFGARVWGVQYEVMACWEVHTTNTLSDTRINTIQPAIYHSVTLGVPELHDVTVVGQARNFGIYQNGNTSKAILFRPDATHTVLVSAGAFDTQGQVVTHAGFPLFLGGAPRYWDGVGVWPAGIPVAPAYELNSIAGVATFDAGVYTYALVFEWYDARGRRQQSPVRIQTYTASVLSNQVAVTAFVRSWPFDERLAITGDVTVVVYRSEVNDTILRRGDSTAFALSRINFADESYVVFMDFNALDVFSGEPLYTAGGSSELASTALESTKFARGLSDRFLTVHPNFPEQLVYTKTIKQGRGLEPNQALVFIFPQTITGLAYQDGNVYCFARDNVWAANLAFADDTGLNGGAVDPVGLSTGIGCVQPLSIIETPVGVFFVGPRGFYQLARGGGAPQFVGYEVEKTYNDYPTVKGVAHNALTHEVAWACVDGANEHRIIVYNYQAQQWFTWRLGTAASNPDVNVSGGLAKAPTGFAVATNTEVFTCSDANVNDNSGSGAVDIQTEIVTRDFTVANIGVFTRVKDCALVARPVGTAGVTISESHDSGVSFSAGEVFTFADTEPVIYQTAVQKTRGVRLKFTRSSGNIEAYMGLNLRVAKQDRAYTQVGKRKG